MIAASRRAIGRHLVRPRSRPRAPRRTSSPDITPRGVVFGRRWLAEAAGLWLSHPHRTAWASADAQRLQLVADRPLADARPSEPSQPLVDVAHLEPGDRQLGDAVVRRSARPDWRRRAGCTAPRCRPGGPATRRAARRRSCGRPGEPASARARRRPARRPSCHRGRSARSGRACRRRHDRRRPVPPTRPVPAVGWSPRRTVADERSRDGVGISAQLEGDRDEGPLDERTVDSSADTPW